MLCHLPLENFVAASLNLSVVFFLFMAMLEGVVASPLTSSAAGLSSSRPAVSSSFGGPNVHRIQHNNNSLHFNPTPKFQSLTATTHNNNNKMLAINANHQKSNDFVFKASGNQDGGEIEKEDGGEKQMSKEEEFAKAKPIVLTPKSGLWYKMRDACWKISPILLALNKNEEELILNKNEDIEGEKSSSENLELEKKILDKRIENTIKLFEEEKYGEVLVKNQSETSERIKEKLNEGNEYAWRIKNVLNFVVSKIPDALLAKPKIVTEIPQHLKYYDETGLY